MDYFIPPLKWIGIKQEVAQLATSFKNQADLRIEANNLERFLVHFHGCEDRISFPHPIYPFISQDVLIESLEIGLPLEILFQFLEPLTQDSEKSSTSSSLIKEVNEQIISTIFAAFLKMVLLDNFSHADLHPGNLLIQIRGHPNVHANTTSNSGAPWSNALKMKLYKARAYLWPIARFRAAVLSDLSTIEKKEFGNNVSFLLPYTKVFSPLEASPWLSASSPLSSIPSIQLSLSEQEELMNVLFLKKKNTQFSGGVSVRVIFLDAGLITSLDSVRFSNFLDLFKTLILWRDGYNAGKLVIGRNPLNCQGTVINEEEFCTSLQFMVQNFFSSHPPLIRGVDQSLYANFPLLSHLPLGTYHIGPVLLNFLKLVKDHHVRLDDQYASLVMSVVFVEGLGRRLCPHLDLLPFLKQAALHYFLRT